MAADGGAVASTSDRQAGEASASSQKGPSCIPYFDALWFCYSPVYQVKEYYVEGKLDDCTQHWGTLMNCLRQKTKFKDTEPESKSKVNSLWTIRTPEEAAAAWDAEFRSAGSPAAEHVQETVA